MILDRAERDLIEGFHFYESQGLVLGSYFLTNLYADIESLQHVNSGISRELAARGLNHQPKKLPRRQEHLVRVFKKGSPVASFISAVLAVKPQNDAVIRKAAGADTSST